jgi:hypothetical protein
MAHPYKCRCAVCCVVALSILAAQLRRDSPPVSGTSMLPTNLPLGDDGHHTPDDQEPMGPVYTINVVASSSSMLTAPPTIIKRFYR